MDRWIRSASRWAIVPATVMALGLASSAAHAADVYFACFKISTGKIRPSSIVANSSPICKSSEIMRTWNEEGPQGPPGQDGQDGQNGFASCHTEEYLGTCGANTFAVLNSSCSTGLLTGAGAIWATPFDGADNGPFYFYPRSGTLWTIVPYNHTGVISDFKFVLTCCTP